MNADVDAYLNSVEQWRSEFIALRRIMLECDLVEQLKWGNPCYSLQKANIVLIHGFKDYCAMLFFKGALLEDPEGLLIRQTANVQAARQIRFEGIVDITGKEAILRRYIEAAIEIERAGLKVPMKSTADFAVAEEFEVKLADLPDLSAAFARLTPGRQKAYLLHFSAPKQSKTRLSRIEKSIPLILEGKGLTD